MASSGVAHGSARSVSERLKAATDELQKLEQLVVSGDCAPRVLTEFRGAVDSIRQRGRFSSGPSCKVRIAIPTLFSVSFPKNA